MLPAYQEAIAGRSPAGRPIAGRYVKINPLESVKLSLTAAYLACYRARSHLFLP